MFPRFTVRPIVEEEEAEELEDEEEEEEEAVATSILRHPSIPRNSNCLLERLLEVPLIY